MSNQEINKDVLAEPQSIVLRGVKLHAITQDQCIGLILDRLDAGVGGWVITCNLDYLLRLVRDRDFAKQCEQADIAVADGMPLVWASRIQGTPLPERIAGSTIIGELSGAAGSRGKSVYLLGGNEGTAEAAAEVLKSRYPDLTVAGTYCPAMGFEKDQQQMQAMAQAVQAARPDIVFVALGSPKQELVIEYLREKLPGAWWMGVGISFSFLCGEVKRAPLWVQKIGLEWVHRLLQEPGRLGRRYLIDGIPFGVGLIFRAIGRRLFGVKKRSVNRDSPVRR